MKKLNSKVVYDLVREISQKLRKENRFDEDPELYVIGTLIAARDNIRPGATIGQMLEKASWEDVQEIAARLLRRKKVSMK